MVRVRREGGCREAMASNFHKRGRAINRNDDIDVNRSCVRISTALAPT